MKQKLKEYFIAFLCWNGCVGVFGGLLYLFFLFNVNVIVAAVAFFIAFGTPALLVWRGLV